METEIIQPLAQFGVAGLMGLLWVWERRLSRAREQQLSDTHLRLMQEREEVRVLTDLVSQNTHAITRFDQTLTQAMALLERMQHVHTKV